MQFARASALAPYRGSYSAELETIASAVVQKVGDFAPHNILARHLSKLLRAYVVARTVPGVDV